LRDAILLKRETIETVEIFSARVLAVSRFKRFPNRFPNAMLELCVGRGGDRRAGLVSHRNLRDCVTSRTIRSVSEARVIGVELHQRIAIETVGVVATSDHPHVYMVA
jgi:hypothetical protein